MPHITSTGAGMFSDLSVSVPATNLTAAEIAALDTAAEFQALFATEIASDGGTPAAGAFVRIKNIREYPSMGTPPNIVNVPEYGSTTSNQIQGQSDSPSMEITLNYIPETWKREAGNILGNMVNDGIQRCFRFSLLNYEPDGYASTAAGLGTVENSQFYWVGKLEAILVNPQLTDSNTATITLTVQTDFFGAFTNASA